MDTSRKAEVSLRESEERYRLLVENAPYPIAVHQDERIVFVNPAAARLVGAERPDELVGRSLWDFVPPEFLDVVRERMARVHGGGIIEPLEERLIRLDGSQIDVEIVAIPFEVGGRPAVQVVIRDVSRQKELERELRSSEAHFRSLIESSSDVLTVLERDGKIVFSSPSILRVLGYPPADLEGRTAFDFVHPDDLAGVRERCETALRSPGVPVRHEFRLRRADGTWSYLETVARAVVTDEIPFCVVVNARDVNERREMQTRLERVLDDARASDRLKTAFLANVSHEIRTPLSVILGYVEILVDDFAARGDAGQAQVFEAIHRAGRRLTRMLHAILDIAQMEAGTFEPRPVDLDVGPVVERIVESFRAVAVEKGITLEWEADDTDVVVRADENCLASSLESLVDNAIKFTAKGSVRVRVTKGPDGEVRITVTDTGIGIPPAFLSRLFDPFVQAEWGADRRYEGAGLGLALARRYAEANRAKLTVASEEGKGSTFMLSFSAPGDVPAEEKPVVLVLEDDPDSLRYMQTLLHSSYRVLSATTAAEGWAQLEAEENAVRAIVADIGLGSGEDGLSFTRRVHSDPRFAGLPVIAVTAFALREDRANALQAGCDAWISKPFQRRELFEVLERFVSPGRRL